MQYNATQRLVRYISGYEPYGSFTSAKNDGYYELSDRQEKMDFLYHFIENAPFEDFYSGDTYNLMKNADIYKAYDFLEDNFSGENERFHAFNDL